MPRFLVARAVLLSAVALMSRSGPRAAPGDLVGDYLPFSTIAPQDLAYDPVENCFWITAFLDDRIYKFSSDLREQLDMIPSPFVVFEFQTGIAYNPIDDTLLVTSAASRNIVEIDKDGRPTDRQIAIPIHPDSPADDVTVRSLVFDALGDKGRGSLYVVESLGTAIYEFTLEGEALGLFSHPEDPDGFPGDGRHASAAGLDVVRDGSRVTGYWVSGVRDRENRLLLVDPDGDYTGVHVSLNAAGGTVSSVLRHPFPDPVTGEPLDAWICVVESNARFAVIEAGEPPFREIFDLRCESADNGSVRLTWESRQTYERVEILHGCEVLATLPGDAAGWEGALTQDGTYRLGVRAIDGGQASEIDSCVIVIGSGRLLRSRPVGGSFAADIAVDEELLVTITDAVDRRLIIFDPDLEDEPLSIVPIDGTFVMEDEFVTGICPTHETGEFLIYNTTAHVIGHTDFTGEVFDTFDVELPNIDPQFDPDDPESEPDLGTVFGMAFDRDGNDGQGSVWLVETVRDMIYEVDLSGQVTRSFPSPFRELDPAPVENVFSTYTSGISIDPRVDDVLWVTGGTYRDLRQRWIARVDVETESIVPGSLITTDGLRSELGAGSFTIEVVREDLDTRLFVVSIAGERSSIAEIDHELPAVPRPTYPSCRQQSHASDVELTFINGGPYDAIAVFRDCTQIATIAGSSTRFVDGNVPPGIREYAVRGLVAGRPPSDFARCSLRVGVGAVLQRVISYPARSPQQIARDPIDGSILTAVNWFGDERKVYRFDRNFRFLDEHESSVDPTRRIATLAVRAPSASDRSLYIIDWLQPVPIGEADSQRFFLINETLSGERLGSVEIFPPRPTNGFLTFPAGLTWDAESDTFFYLERNSKTFVRMDPSGVEIGRFPHPAPPFQNFVFNLGLTIVPERRTLLFTTADDTDHGVTLVREMDFEGRLTELSVALRETRNTIRDIESHGREIIAVGTGSFSEILRVKAEPGAPQPFLRGDVDQSGAVDLGDAVTILGHLFRNGDAPACPDAADADDSGSLSITDAIAILNHLFRGQEAIAAPFPEPGQDTTPDGLGCR